ncbi:MAG: amidohydrolase [Anaerolineaceae bacterium]|nr:amidohydrolase [Anaerolineaceae bacterium]
MKSINGTDILGIARELSPWIVEKRRTIHSRPELSYHEHETAAFVATNLRECGFEVSEGIGGTGVVGILEGERKGRTVALRADIDALPIDEANEIEYRSVNESCMHACGHDGHTAIVLGAAKLLASKRDSLIGNIKFIFQPAEEVPPEGGAKGMIADGVLQNPTVDAIFGLHIWPDLPAGEIGLKSGPIMAAADKMILFIRGKGGHGATPHHTVDTLVLTAQIILALHTLVSRKIDPLKSAVLSICRCNAGTAYNILPEEVRIEGTTRYFDKELGNFLEAQIHQVVKGRCEGHGGSYELDYQYGFPPTINDPGMTAGVARAATEILGKNKVHWIEEPSMTGEDFSYFLQEVPGCYFWLGTGNPDKGIIHPLHSSRFQIDEEILPLGVATLVQTVLDFLNS